MVIEREKYFYSEKYVHFLDGAIIILKIKNKIVSTCFCKALII